MRRSNTLILPRRHRRLLRHEKRLNERGFSVIAGIDEAGRGPLAGPVVAGAVIPRTYRFESCIDDSKRLTASQRECAFDEIVAKSAVGIGIISESVIDEINIYEATKRAMLEAFRNLGAMPAYVLVDGRLNLAFPCPYEFIIGGDAQSFSIACASIIAKVTRDRIMRDCHKKYPQYGFSRHKGYGTKAHKDALQKLGPSPIHRRSFQPIKSMVSNIKS